MIEVEGVYGVWGIGGLEVGAQRPGVEKHRSVGGGSLPP